MPTADTSLPQGGQPLRRAFESLIATLNERGVRYAVIGGLAVIQHARVRTTDDIDVLLDTPQLAMPGLFDALGERGFQVDSVGNSRELRDDGITLVRFGEVIVDLMRPLTPAYARVLDRSVTATILGLPVRISSPEGLIVMKLIARRPQDQADVQDLLAAYAGQLDLEFVRTEMAGFTKADDPLRAAFEEWVRASQPPV